MKTVKLFFSLILVGMVGLLFVQCEKEVIKEVEVSAAVYSISGNITYPDFSGSDVAAPGAVVFLQVDGTGASTDYDMSAVADASGNYSFTNLLPGNYFVWASYNTNNTNLNGRYDDITFTGEGVAIEVVAADVTQAMALATATETGSVLINTVDQSWNFDGSHSSVVFGFPYDIENSEFIGQFTGFNIGIVFDQTNLAASEITATIDLTTVDTGQPGRDALGKCIGSTLGVVLDPADTLDDGSINPATIPLNSTGVTTFTSTSIEKYGNGYLAKGNMVFMGSTVAVNLFFTYIAGFEAPNRSDVLTRYSSFKGTMEFAALDGFGLDSGHIGGNNVTVYVSAQVNAPI